MSSSSRSLRLWFALALGIAALSSCKKPATADAPADAVVAPGTVDAADNDPGAYERVQQQLNARLEAIHDFEVTETIVAADGETLRFRYSMQQPAFTAVEQLGEGDARLRAFIFDGKTLAIVDDGAKTVVRQDLSQAQEQMMLTLHEVFSPFICEGWRPPLMRPAGGENGTVAVVVGSTVELRTTVGTDGHRNVVVLDNDGGFVLKQTTDASGAVVVGTTVTKSEVDAATKLRFPTAWNQLENGQVATSTTVNAWSVNQGVSAARFSTTTPSGYTDVVAPAAAAPVAPTAPATP
ncbi:MAG TPA: hypothetical protein VGF99_03175 [Myxococcota bacterium]